MKLGLIPCFDISASPKVKCESYSSNANRTSRNKNRWNNSMYILMWKDTSPSCFLKFIFIQLWEIQQTRQYGTIHIHICWRMEPVLCCLSSISDSIAFHLMITDRVCLHCCILPIIINRNYFRFFFLMNVKIYVISR
jgi:hypothetical protein